MLKKLLNKWKVVLQQVNFSKDYNMKINKWTNSYLKQSIIKMLINNKKIIINHLKNKKEYQNNLIMRWQSQHLFYQNLNIKVELNPNFKKNVLIYNSLIHKAWKINMIVIIIKIINSKDQRQEIQILNMDRDHSAFNSKIIVIEIADNLQQWTKQIVQASKT